jgi:pimeloyl-ACP methyl ester carboxylesterase
MERAVIDGITLEHQVSGAGEPVVFIHGAFIADTFLPLAVDPDLVNRYRLVVYHRRGYGGSSRPAGSIGVAQQAADCCALLRHLGIERAHVVGHSFGGSFAIQLTLDFPEVVHSLALLEPALMIGASGAAYRESLVQSEQRYRQVGAAAVMDGFLQARWPEYRAELDTVLSGGHAQALADAGTTLEVDIPGFLEWGFDEADVRRITQPVLAVLGGDSEAISPRFGEAQRLLLTHLPHVEGVVIPGTTHFMQLQKPRDMAEALTAFWAHHPLSA